MSPVMNENRFLCTRCGLCCQGWLPLTLCEALTEAERFPLAMVLTPVKSSDKTFPLAERIGLPIPITKRQHVALVASPTAYIPPSLRCPALSPDNRCALHPNKPLRCRTMPFDPRRAEDRQADLLVPRKGWSCVTGAEAPVVYRDRRVVERTDFENERQALLDQAGEVRTWTAKLLQRDASLAQRVTHAAQSPIQQRVVVTFFPFLRMGSPANLQDFARHQIKAVTLWAAKTANLPSCEPEHAYYTRVRAELEPFVQDA